jgi:hypothetical protein
MHQVKNLFQYVGESCTEPLGTSRHARRVGATVTMMIAVCVIVLMYD